MRAGKFSNMLTFFDRVLCACTNHWGKVPGMPLYCSWTCKTESTLIDSRILGNFAASSNIRLQKIAWSLDFLNWKQSRAVVSFKLVRLVIVSLSRKVSIWSLEINLSLGGFRVVLLVSSNDDSVFSGSLECFVGMGFIDHFKFDSPHQTMYFSSKWSSHKTESFVGFQFLRLTNQIYSLLSTKFFKGKWYFVICSVSFIA